MSEKVKNLPFEEVAAGYWKKILTRLDNEDGFLLFEERHPDYFATMDMVARGRTNRDRVKPLLTREDLNS